MVKQWKRILSMFLVMAMIFNMIPQNTLQVHAAEVTDAAAAQVGDTIAVEGSEDEPADSSVAGTHWENMVKSADATCGKIEHTHTDGCYDLVLSCDHAHVQGCYTSYERCYYGGISCSHAFHYWDSYKCYGSSTLTCSHAHVDSCYSVGTDLGEGCPTRSWRNGNVLEGDFGGWEFYEHTHTEPACYTYTWTLAWNVYDVSVAINNNTVDVVASDVPTTGTHGTDVSFKLSATGDQYNTWTAKIGDKAFPLSATEETTVTAYGITSGHIEVELTSDPVPTYSVSLEQNALADCSAVFEGDHQELLPGTDVIVKVSIPAATATKVYSYVVEVTGASYTKNTDGITVKVDESDATVKITYSVKELIANSSIGDVEFNPSKAAADQLSVLKTAIFNAVVNADNSIPEGISVDDVEISYHPYHLKKGNITQITAEEFDASLIALGTDASGTETDGAYSNTYYTFGTRFATADTEETKNDALEKVRITGKSDTSWDGLYVEAEITLTHTHNWGDPVVTNPTCEEGGYKTTTCTICGESVKSDLVNASGHSTIDHDAKAPTCTEAGWEAYQSCNRCSWTTKVEIPATNHKDTLVQVDALAATCTADGHNAYEYCTACTYTTKVVDPMTGHDMRDDWYKVDGSENCTGSTMRRDCHNAGCKHYETKGGDGAGHSLPNDWTVTTPATCSTDGEKRKKCENCDYYESERIPATKHKDTLVQVDAQIPDCDSIGWDAYEYCTACDHSTYVEKSALGHGHDEGYRYDNKEDGTHNVLCLDCNTVTKTEGHAFNANHECDCGAIEGFVITFKNWNGENIKSGSVEYNTMPVVPTDFSIPAYHTFTGWDSTVTAVSGPKTYTAQITLNANNGELTINKSIEDASEHLKGLKNKVLTAAGLPNSGDYTVTTIFNVTVLTREVTLTLEITNEGVNEILPSGLEWAAEYVDGAALLAADLADKTFKDFTITDAATNVSKTVEHTIVDVRLPIAAEDIAISDTGNYGSFNTEDQFKDAVKNSVTVTWRDKDGKSGTVASDRVTVTYSEPAVSVVDGKTQKVYTVTVTVPLDGTNWLANTTGKRFTGKSWTVNQYEITWIDGNGDKLHSEMVDYGTTPVYNGATPTKKANLQYTYTFNNTWSPAIASVSGAATYTAQFDQTVNKYTVTWLNGDGIEIYSEDVEYGTVPQYDFETYGTPSKISNDPKIVYTWDTGWDKTVEAVTGDVEYTATFTEDTIYIVTFDNDGVLTYGYVNKTRGEKTLEKVENPDDIEGFIFVGWFDGETEFTAETEVTANITVTAKWIAESNNNNVLDEEETVNVEIQNGGSISFNGAAPVDGEFVFDSKNNNYTVVITPPANHYVASVEIAGVNLLARNTNISYDNGVMTISGVSLTDGDTIKAAFAEHTIPAVSNPSMVVNGKDADTKLAEVTKKTVLETVLGRTVTDAELDQYDVKIKVTVAGYNGPVDIWALITELEGKTDTISQSVLSALKSAFNTAIDVPGGETFEITWKAHDKYPEVKGEYTVALTERRQPTTVTHAEGVTYTATALNDGLLAQIQENLTSNATIYKLAYVDPSQVLTPGTTADVEVTVTVLETELLYGATHTITVKVNVPASDIDIRIPAKATIYFNTGMSSTDKVALLKEAVPYVSYVIGTDILATDVVEKSFKIQYLASVAHKVPFAINLKQLDLGVFGDLLINALGSEEITVYIPVDEMWLDMTTTGNDYPVTEAPSNAVIRDIMLNELIPNYGADYLAGNISDEDLKDIAAELVANHPDIAAYYKYLGAHQFGEQETETIRYIVDTQFGAKETNECVLSMVDERTETEIKLNTGVEVTYNAYTEAELLALLLDGVYADGAKIDGLTVEFVTEVEDLPASEASNVTVKFAGNEDYKPSEASVAVKINKASVTVSVDNRLYKWQEGQFYTLSDVILTNPAGVQTINFIAGFNISDVNLDDGLKGFVTQVQLMLPEELQSLLETADVLLQGAGLNVSFANGASMKLSELQGAVEALDGLFAGSEYEEYFRVLLNMLASLPTETADIEIIVGGTVPTDIGVYVVGAISADSNYTTDFGVGAVVIYPDGTKVDLAWNQIDDNYVITNTLLRNGTFDTGAHAIKVYDDRYTLEEATAQVGEIFLGVDIDGNITLEMDQAKLNVGAYVEVAMIVNFGNEMLYSEPLIRPIVVVAETLDVDFVDASGAVNNDRHYEFYNIPQNGMEGNLLITYKQDGEGYQAGEEFICPDGSTVSIKYVYAGVQTNAQPHVGQDAPVHAGAYTITAIVVVRDETGYITHAGQGIGALVIEPSQSTTDVENEAIRWDGEEHVVNQFVDADSVNVPELTPDTTVISAGIGADLDANIGLDAIQGNVNVDMPSWMDDLLKRFDILQAGYTEEGIDVKVFLSYVEKLEAELTDLGVEVESFTKIVDVIKQLPDKATLTFHDNKGYKNVGVYLIIGIVTDSDHYPSADAGVMVIYPDAEKVDLKFNKTWDDNNVFTWQYLQSYDLNAKAYQLGTDVEIPAATDKVTNLFVGFADHGELLFTADKAELDNGVYAQVAFILDLNNSAYYAEPISREVIIVPNNADIDFVDADGNVNNERHFDYNAQAHAMNTIRVTLADGTVLDLTAEDSRVDIFYVGVQSNGAPYASYEAPVNTGVYEVTAQYTSRDAKDRVIDLGIGVGVMVIEASKSETTVDNEAILWDGQYHEVKDLVHASSVNVPGLTPDTTIISAGLSTDLDNITGLDAINGTVNIDLPVWMDNVMDKLDILEAGYADGISAEVFLDYAEKLRAGLVELGVDTASFDEIVDFVEQLPITTNLTFADDASYKEVGAYLVVAVVTDFNHYPSAGAGILVIYPDATKVELQFEEDWNGNNIFTWNVLKNMNLEAKAYLNGAYCEPADQKVVNLYFGFTDNGQFLLESVVYGETLEDVPEFDNGVYTQLAFVNDFGNVMYYAKPISREFMIVPTPAIIEFVDENGNVNDDRHFIFTNEQQGMDIRVTIAGKELTDLSGLNVRYTGIQTNGKAYSSTEAPIHSGAYVVTATYIAKDAQGRLVTMGAEVGAMVIEPAQAEIDVDSVAHEYDGNAVNTGDMIVIDSGIAGLTPDKTVITAGIKTDGTFSENLLDAIVGEINVDLPAWVDEILFQIDGAEDGVSVAGAIVAIEKVEAKLVALAAEAGLEVELKNFDALIEVLEQLPQDLTVTFENAPSYKEVGAYLVIGVVTDSDFYPAMDAGVLVIYPDVDEAKLHWIYEDSNNIFTLDTLSVIDLGAYATVDGAKSDKVPFQVLYLGVNAETMEIELTRDQADLGLGMYTEVAYVLDISSQMYVAAPIIRELMIVPNIYDVQAEDITDVYDGTAKAVEDIIVLNQFEQDITAEGEMNITYIGISAGVDGYLSTEAPTNAGIYQAVITFITYDAEGNFTGAGSKIVNILIEKADPVYDVLDATVVYDGEEHMMDIINEQNVDYALLIRTEDGYNLQLTAGLKTLEDILSAGEYDLTALKDAIESAIEKAEDLEIQSEFLNKLLDAVLKEMEKINDSVIYKVTINGENPVEVGEYHAYAITVPTTNYKMDVSEGTLTIQKADVTITVNSDSTMHINGTLPQFTITVEGDVASNRVVAAVDTSAVKTDVAGDYVVTAKVDDNQFDEDNYNIIIVDAKLTVTDHDWTVSYSWNQVEGEWTCTATRTCAISEACTETAIATITSAVKTPADCMNMGTTTYTATFEESWADTQTKDVADIPATDHKDEDGDNKCDICDTDMGGQTVGDPTINVPTLSGSNIYGFAVQNGILYIDTVKTGLTIADFVKQLNVPFSNDADNKVEVVVTYGGNTLTGTDLIRTEAKVTLTAENAEGTKATLTYDVVVIGDVNRNGEVDSGDASLMMRDFFKKVSLTNLQKDAADTNRTGERESGDAVKNEVKYNKPGQYQSNLPKSIVTASSDNTNS